MASTEIDIQRELIEKCRQGDRRSFHEVYRLYSGAMFNVCLRLLGNREDAEDMLQEAFVEIFRRIKEFRQESTFGYWIKQIVVNKSISALRKKKVKLQLLDDMETLDREEEEEIISEYEEALKVEWIKKAMQELPDGSRSIFSLYLFEGYDHIEIADILNITESTSKSQYMRARLKVKAYLKQHQYERG